jgi:hypothetical protein
MMLMGVDYHPSFQTIAFFVEETGECGEQELNHSDGQAEEFYRGLKQQGICVRAGMEVRLKWDHPRKQLNHLSSGAVFLCLTRIFVSDMAGYQSVRFASYHFF